MSKIWNIDNVLIMLKLVGGFMEVVINDLEELKKYMRVYKGVMYQELFPLMPNEAFYMQSSCFLYSG